MQHRSKKTLDEQKAAEKAKAKAAKAEAEQFRKKYPSNK